MTRVDPLLLELQAAVAGRYAVDRELGRGGMGVVYLAQDVALLRPVAIKVLAPDLARRPEIRERFLREARTVAALSHPNIVPIFAVEEHRELLFFVMAYIEGESLGARIERNGPLSDAETETLLRDLAWALGYAHGRGIVHRDVKPDNVLLERATQRVLLTDFGIAHRESDNTLSGAGELVGTVQYMSPEQANGAPIDGRADLYALGLVGLFALSGRPPLGSGSMPVLLSRLLQGAAIDVDALVPGANPALRDLLTRLTSRDPVARPVSGEAVAGELDARAVREVTAPMLRIVVQQTRNFANALGVAATAAVPLWMFVDSETFQSWMVPAMGMPVLVLVTSGIVTVLQTRTLIRHGFSFGDLQRAVQQSHRSMREEAGVAEQAAIAQVRSNRRAYRRFAIILGGFSVIGGVIGFFEAILPGPAVDRWLGAFVAVGAFGLMATAVETWREASAEGPPPRKKSSSYWLNMLDPASLLVSRFGAWLFSRVERRATTAPTAPAAPRLGTATELLSLDRVLAAVEMLPDDLRLRIGDIADIARALADKGEALRRRIAAADAGAAASVADPDQRLIFEEARARFARRLADLHVSMESLRLDLLRVATGLSADITIARELEKARELSAAIDAELHGHAEVKKLFG